jgi:hypothetical protein
MNRTISNFLLIFPILLFLLVACNPNYNPDKQYKSGKAVKATPVNSKTSNIEYITGPLTNDSQTNQGLYKVTLEDGKEILIYRGTESVSMIQLN